MDNQQNETQNTWNKVAQVYADKFLSLGIYTDSYERFFKGLASDASVLDVGCGPGVIAYFLSKNYPKMTYQGLDYAENMIELAQKHFPQYEFFVKDARQLAEFPGEFNALCAGFCLPYLSIQEVPEFLKECHFKLSEKGRFYLSFVPGEQNSTREVTGSTGDSMKFTSFEKEWLIEELQLSGFKLLDECLIDFERPTGIEEHCAFILEKIG